VAPLTLEEHRELATELKLSSARLRQLCGLVVDVYGAHSAAGFTFAKALEAIGHLQQELEAQAVRDFNGHSAGKLYL
jgi:hypothetical protein